MYVHRKPGPIQGRVSPKRCPVCHQSSYSLEGIHPQCARQQADLKRITRLKAERIAAEADADSRQ